MKKELLNYLAIIITILGIPSSIIFFVAPNLYKTNETLIWCIISVIVLFVTLIQLPELAPAKLTRWLRKAKFHLFRTKIISIIFVTQLSLLLIMRTFLSFLISSDILMMSYGISIIGIFLMILADKIPNNDAKKILYRRPNGKIYLLQNNKLKFIPDPITFNLLGFKWADPVDISEESFKTYELDIPFTSALEVPFKIKRNIYYAVDNGTLRAIPDLYTFNRIKEHGNNNAPVEDDSLEGYTVGEPYVPANW